MSEREYPRWIHGDGHKSVVANTADEEKITLVQWAEEDAAEAETAGEMPNMLTSPRRGGWPKGKPRGNRQDAVN